MFGQIKSLLPDVICIKLQRKKAPLRTVEMEYALKPVYTCLGMLKFKLLCFLTDLLQNSLIKLHL